METGSIRAETSARLAISHNEPFSSQRRHPSPEEGRPAEDDRLRVMEHRLGYGTVTSYPLWDGVCVALGIQLSHSLYLNVKDMYSCPCMAHHIWRLTGSPVVSCVVEAGA